VVGEGDATLRDMETGDEFDVEPDTVIARISREDRAL
jgi:hypothetical protein